MSIYSYYKYTHKKGAFMQNLIKLALLSVVTAGVFSACSFRTKKCAIL